MSTQLTLNLPKGFGFWSTRMQAQWAQHRIDELYKAAGERDLNKEEGKLVDALTDIAQEGVGP